jgi:hypothetical protein
LKNHENDDSWTSGGYTNHPALPGSIDDASQNQEYLQTLSYAKDAETSARATTLNPLPELREEAASGGGSSTLS